MTEKDCDAAAEGSYQDYLSGCKEDKIEILESLIKKLIIYEIRKIDIALTTPEALVYEEIKKGIK